MPGPVRSGAGGGAGAAPRAPAGPPGSDMQRHGPAPPGPAPLARAPRAARLPRARACVRGPAPRPEGAQPGAGTGAGMVRGGIGAAAEFRTHRLLYLLSLPQYSRDSAARPGAAARGSSRLTPAVSLIPGLSWCCCLGVCLFHTAPLPGFLPWAAPQIARNGSCPCPAPCSAMGPASELLPAC